MEIFFHASDANSFIIDGCDNGVTPPIASRGDFTLEIDSQVFNLSAQMMCVEGDSAAAHGVGVHAILRNNSERKLRILISFVIEERVMSNLSIRQRMLFSTATTING